MLAFLKIEGAVSWQSEVRRMIYIYIYMRVTAYTTRRGHGE